MASRVEITGIAPMRHNLQTIKENFRPKITKAMEEEGELELREMIDITPWKTRALQRSGRIVITPMQLRFVFGGGPENVTYARTIHEDLFLHHPHGQAKFITTILFQSRAYLPQRIARRARFNRSWLI